MVKDSKSAANSANSFYRMSQSTRRMFPFCSAFCAFSLSLGEVNKRKRRERRVLGCPFPWFTSLPFVQKDWGLGFGCGVPLCELCGLSTNIKPPGPQQKSAKSTKKNRAG